MDWTGILLEPAKSWHNEIKINIVIKQINNPKSKVYNPDKSKFPQKWPAHSELKKSVTIALVK